MGGKLFDTVFTILHLRYVQFLAHINVLYPTFVNVSAVQISVELFFQLKKTKSILYFSPPADIENKCVFIAFCFFLDAKKLAKFYFVKLRICLLD